MPPKNTRLVRNCQISVTWHFLKTTEAKQDLKGKVPSNSPGKVFTGTVISLESLNDGNVMCDIIKLVDAIEGKIYKVPATKLKYQGPKSRARTVRRATKATKRVVAPAIEISEQEKEDMVISVPGPSSTTEASTSSAAVAITGTTTQANADDDWKEGPIEVDARLTAANSSYSGKAKFNLPHYETASPADYFLFFLPIEFIQRVVLTNINTHGMSVVDDWVNITYLEYLTWITLFMNMTIMLHVDKRAYWHKGSSHILPTINFNKYMDIKRFKLITKYHIFELPDATKEGQDSLYQIRDFFGEFNKSLAKSINPGVYICVDESMNQWLGEGMPNVKKVPRKPHSIGQEFKTLADDETYCIIQLRYCKRSL